MIFTVTPEFFGGGYCKKSETVSKPIRRTRKKSLFNSGTWPTARSTEDDRTIVLSSGLGVHRWNRLDNRTRSLIYQLTLNGLGKSYPFTINFDRDVAAKALATTRKPFSRWVDDRLRHYLRNLERELGHQLPYWFAAEITRSGILHIHGVIGVNDNFVHALKPLFRKVSGGSGGRADRWFVRVKEFNAEKHYQHLYGSLGWAAYSTKQLHITEKNDRIGSALVCRRELNQRAQEVWRGLWVENLRRGVERELGRPVSEEPGELLEVPAATFASMAISHSTSRARAFTW